MCINHFICAKIFTTIFTFKFMCILMMIFIISIMLIKSFVIWAILLCFFISGSSLSFSAIAFKEFNLFKISKFSFIILFSKFLSPIILFILFILFFSSLTILIWLLFFSFFSFFSFKIFLFSLFWTIKKYSSKFFICLIILKISCLKFLYFSSIKHY